jgi:hypothetical protein
MRGAAGNAGAESTRARAGGWGDIVAPSTLLEDAYPRLSSVQLAPLLTSEIVGDGAPVGAGAGAATGDGDGASVAGAAGTAAGSAGSVPPAGAGFA